MAQNDRNRNQENQDSNRRSAQGGSSNRQDQQPNRSQQNQDRTQNQSRSGGANRSSQDDMEDEESDR
jgi:hypothetical protein